MRAAMSSSHALSFTHPEGTYPCITYHEAFYMGTLGGAKGRVAGAHKGKRAKLPYCALTNIQT